jgi:hypothetical protein
MMPTAAAISGLRKASVKPGIRRNHMVQRCGSGSCACDPEHDAGLVQRTSVVSTASMKAAPDSVHDALRSPGTALDADTRAFFEPLFDHDFSRVRVHTGQAAADSAEAISARAYTVGNDIVLRSGSTGQALAPGSRLLAHELAHVVQQAGGMPPHGQLEIGPASSPAEGEADRIADHVLNGRRVRVSPSPAGAVRRQLSCPELINPGDQQAVAGIGTPAHNAIEEHARRSFKRSFWQQVIPGSSFAPWRTEDRDPRHRADPKAGEETDPQLVGGKAGPGTPDLGFRSGTVVELAEVKPAILSYGTVGGLLEGELQLANYVLKGNADENKGWRGRRRISEFAAMKSTRLAFPPQLTTSTGQRIAAGWCLPGVIGYRPLTREEAETILCGVSDRGMVSAFLDSAMDGAERLVDQYVDEVGKAIAQRVNGFTLREGIVVLSRYAESGLKKIAAALGGPGTEALMDLIPNMELTEGAADFVADNIGGPALEQMLRLLATQIKDRLLAEVRAQLKRQIRSYLQEAFAAACAAAAVGATVSAAALLKRFGEDLAKRFLEGVVAVSHAWAATLAKELAKSLVVTLLVAIAVALLIFFLPEILAGLSAVAGFAIAAAGAVAAAGPQLMKIISDLVDLVMQESSAF